MSRVVDNIIHTLQKSLNNKKPGSESDNVYKLFFPPQRTYTKCSSISPFFMTHISVNIHLMQFSTKYTHSFSLRNYANCLRHEAEKTQYCTYPQKVHNLERQPASLKILTPYRNFRTQSTYNVQGRHKKRRSPRLPEGK